MTRNSLLESVYVKERGPNSEAGVQSIIDWTHNVVTREYL